MPPQLTAWYADDVIEIMLGFADEARALETGGVLLGYATETEWVVGAVVGPGPDASHWATGFTPDAEWQAERIAELYEASGRRLQYLGDWHTHPAGSAVPSKLDRRTLRRIAHSSAARCPRPLMAILAGSSDESWTLGSYVSIRRDGRRIVTTAVSRQFRNETW